MAIIAIIADQMDFMLNPVAATNPQRSRLKRLGVATDQRLALLPEVPTLREQGVPVFAATWMGFVAPPRTSPNIADALHAAVSRVQRRPEFRETLHNNGFIGLDLDPSSFATFLRVDASYWGNAVRAANIRIDH